MSNCPAIHGAAIWRETADPFWTISPSPTIINEGDTARFTINIANPFAGATIRLWWFGMVGTTSWRDSWHVAIEKAAKAARCTYVRDVGQSPNVLGTLSGRLTIGPGYIKGTPIIIENAALKDRKNNVALNADGSFGTKGAASLQFEAANTTGRARFVGGFQIQVRDSSRTPVGQPTMRVDAFDLDGVTPAAAQLEEGDAFLWRLTTENIIPGTQVKCYIANLGQGRFNPSFRTAIINAAKARSDLDVSFSVYPTPPGEVFYQGATITFLDSYSDSNPFEFVVQTKLDDINQGPQVADFIAAIVKEGSLAEFASTADKGIWASGTSYKRGDLVVWLNDGANYVYVGAAASSGRAPSDTAYWEPYQKTVIYAQSFSRNIKDTPPRFWELAARTDGSTITYSIHVPPGTAGASSVEFASTGTEPPGFAAALDAAIAAHPETLMRAGSRLVATADGLTKAQLTFTVPHPAGTPGKHSLRISDLDGPGWIVIADACVYLTPPAIPVMPYFITGTNLDGGEFGRKDSSGYDNYGFNYRYPHRIERTNPEERYQVMQYHYGKGSRLMRLPFLWGRIQDELFGPLMRNAPPVNNTDRADMWRIDDCIDHWLGMDPLNHVVVDLHNFGKGPNVGNPSNGGNLRYDPTPENNGVPIEALSDLWVKLANRWKDKHRIIFEVMNEPNGATHEATRNRDNMQAVINAIRSRTDALNMIAVPASDYSSAQNFVTNGNAAAFEDFYDPAANYVIVLHTYFDADGSGTNLICQSGTRNRINAATAWARSRGRRLFLTEFGITDPTVPGQEVCGLEEPGMLNNIKQWKDVWFGWTRYFGGDMWGSSFPFTIDPASYAEPVTDNPKMKLLAPFFETNMTPP